MTKKTQCWSCVNHVCAYAGKPMNICECSDYVAPTNGDHIREMRDEELAEFLNDPCPPGMDDSGNCESCGEKCYKCWLDWLRREAGT